MDSVPQLQNPVPATNGTLQILLTSAVDNSTLLAINANPALVSRLGSTDVFGWALKEHIFLSSSLLIPQTLTHCATWLESYRRKYLL